jgi:hypothetical protein
MLNLSACSSSRVNLRGKSLDYEYRVSGGKGAVHISTFQAGNRLYFKGLRSVNGDVTLVHNYNKVREVYAYSASDDFLELIVLPIATPILLTAGTVTALIMTPFGSSKQLREERGPKYGGVPVVSQVSTLFSSFIIPILPGINSVAVRNKTSRPNREVLDDLYVEQVPYPTRMAVSRSEDVPQLEYAASADGRTLTCHAYPNGWFYVELDAGDKEHSVLLKCSSDGKIIASESVSVGPV